MTSELVRGVLAWLATYGLHSTVFLGGTWALLALRPPRADRTRERLWRLALVGGVLSASLQLGFTGRPWFGHIEWAGAAPASTPTTAELERSAARELRAGDVREPAAGLERVEQSPAPRAGEADGNGTTTSMRSRKTARAASGTSRTLPAERETRAERGAVSRSNSPAPVLVAPTAESAGERPRGRAASSPSTTTVAALVAAPPLAPATSPADAPAADGRWPGVLLLAWTALGLLGVLGIAGSWTLLRRRMLGRELLRDGPMAKALEVLRQRAGLRRHVRLSVSDRVRSPFSTGLLRPEICVPRAALALSSAQQDALLAHELGHLVRHDPAWFGLGLLIERVFFFQPLNHVARRHLSELAETACDDHAVRWTGERLALASLLTEVAGWMLGERRPSFSPGLGGHGSRLGKRVTRLLDDRRSPGAEPPARWWPAAAGSALALAALAVPGVSAELARPVEPGRSASTGARAEPPAARPAAARPAVERTPAPAPATAPVGAPVGAPSGARPEPVAVPALTPALTPAVLSGELALLENEVELLRADLAARALDERFEGALALIEERLADLRRRQARVNALLARIDTENTAETDGAEPAPGPADVHHEPDRPGDSR